MLVHSFSAMVSGFAFLSAGGRGSGRCYCWRRRRPGLRRLCPALWCFVSASLSSFSFGFIFLSLFVGGGIGLDMLVVFFLFSFFLFIFPLISLLFSFFFLYLPPSLFSFFFFSFSLFPFIFALPISRAATPFPSPRTCPRGFPPSLAAFLRALSLSFRPLLPPPLPRLSGARRRLWGRAFPPNRCAKLRAGATVPPQQDGSSLGSFALFPGCGGGGPRQRCAGTGAELWVAFSDYGSVGPRVRVLSVPAAGARPAGIARSPAAAFF